MKNKTKILIIFIIALSIISSFSIASFASYSENGIEENTQEKNVFDMIYEALSSNADKLFSLLAFLGTLIMAFVYKKGLFPFVEKALSSLTSAVAKLREEAKLGEENSSSLISELEAKLLKSEELITLFRESIQKLEKELGDAKETKEKSEAMRCIMLSQVEMLYEIFMSSSLPQYQKDRVGESFSKMKTQLSAGEKSDEN